MNSSLSTLLAATLLSPLTVQAASFNFKVHYFDGSVATLAPGSDDPAGVILQPGDHFDWTITAQNSAYWQVTVDNFYFS